MTFKNSVNGELAPEFNLEFGVIDVSPGVLRVVGIKSSREGIPAITSGTSGELTELTFSVKACNDSNLEITDLVGEVADFSTKDGNFTCSNAVTPTPTPVKPIDEPKADFTATQQTGTAPLSVQFTDKSTNDPDTWFWDFGDDGTSVDQNPKHTYSKDGFFSVSLSVSNSAGSDTETKTNFINVLPEISLTPTPVPNTTPTPIPEPNSPEKAALKVSFSPAIVEPVDFVIIKSETSLIIAKLLP